MKEATDEIEFFHNGLYQHEFNMMLQKKQRNRRNWRGDANLNYPYVAHKL